MDSSVTLYERLVSNPRRPWLTLGGALVLLLIPLVGAFLEGFLGNPLITNRLRGMLTAPVTILYILAVSPRLERMGTSVIRDLRPVVLVDDQTFERLVQSAGSVSTRNELLSFGAGVVLGIVLMDWSPGGSLHWLGVYWLVASCLMYGLLSCTIFVAVSTSRVTGVLLRQPLRVDPLDTTPFEAVGRQSLLLALVFVGGIALGMLISVTGPEFLLEPGFWLVNIPIMLTPIIIFFLNMQPTHRVLAAARTRDLKVVQDHIKRASSDFLERLEGGHEAGLVAQEISALAVLEQRLQAARTWPYDVGMLRTLFVSVLVPIFTMLGKLAIDKILG